MQRAVDARPGGSVDWVMGLRRRGILRQVVQLDLAEARACLLEELPAG